MAKSKVSFGKLQPSKKRKSPRSAMKARIEKGDLGVDAKNQSASVTGRRGQATSIKLKPVSARARRNSRSVEWDAVDDDEATVVPVDQKSRKASSSPSTVNAEADQPSSWRSKKSSRRSRRVETPKHMGKEISFTGPVSVFGPLQVALNNITKSIRALDTRIRKLETNQGDIIRAINDAMSAILEAIAIEDRKLLTALEARLMNAFDASLPVASLNAITNQLIALVNNIPTSKEPRSLFPSPSGTLARGQNTRPVDGKTVGQVASSEDTRNKPLR